MDAIQDLVRKYCSSAHMRQEDIVISDLVKVLRELEPKLRAETEKRMDFERIYWGRWPDLPKNLMRLTEQAANGKGDYKSFRSFGSHAAGEINPRYRDLSNELAKVSCAAHNMATALYHEERRK